MKKQCVCFIFLMLFTLLIFSQSDAFRGYIILGRPSDSSITARITVDVSTELFLEYSRTPGVYTLKTERVSASIKNPATILIDGLDAGERYYYRLNFKYDDSDSFQQTSDCSFMTARRAGESFNFAIQSDSHLMNKADKEVYSEVMALISNTQPDLFFDLGDTFLNDQDLKASYEEVNSHYYQQLPYLSEVSKNAPLFLVIGNHEGEYGYLLDGTADNLPTYAALSRKMYFPNPIPDDFYTGNDREEDYIGKPENYYAFTWGDALFVALDPYRYVLKDPMGTGDEWSWTLGEVQYHWLKRTLEESDATFKFVFAHHAIGNMRGGKQLSTLYEWGGNDKKGVYLFDQKRPDWGKPVHQLMVDHAVTIFFQGHDHLFAREDVDGIVYQTLPKPAEVIPDKENNFISYKDADIQLNSGFLDVSISSDAVRVDYIRSVVAGYPDNPSTGVVYSYSIDKSGDVSVLTKADDTALIEAYPASSNEPEKKTEQANKKVKGEKKPKTNAKTKKTATVKDQEVSITLSGNLYNRPFLGSPSDEGIKLSFMFEEQTDYFIRYGLSEEYLNIKTQVKQTEGETMIVEVLSHLEKDREYFYQLCYRKTGDEVYQSSDIFKFHTQRDPSSDYVFLIEADPHFDESSERSVYERVLNYMSEENADFIVDLGDVSMADKLANNEAEIVQRNRLARSYWDNISHSLPFYMVIGNHDGEAGWDFNGKKAIGEIAQEQRRKYFLNPMPDAFYSGLSDKVFSWTWGDALFITLDPYFFTLKKPQTDNWEWTLGKEQYEWLEEVLKADDSAYKFVFIHHLVGGVNKDGRGGAAAAELFEWGGKNFEGVYEFNNRRSDWTMPIHELLKQYEVDIVFHGHDHFYAMEEWDGIIYQMVPQPTLGVRQNVSNLTGEYGYSGGLYLPSPGYLRIQIMGEKARIELIEGENGTVSHAYDIDK